MEEYKDFNYVNYILDLPFDRGFVLFKKCIDKKNFDLEEKNKNQLFKIWLIEIQNGYKESFDTYLITVKSKSNQLTMNDNEKKEKEQMIINKSNEIKDSNVKLKRIKI